MQALLEMLAAILELAGAWDAAHPSSSQEGAEDELARRIGEAQSLREQDSTRYERELLYARQRLGPF